MNALFIVLNKKDYLEEILAILVKRKVTGATILESKGMASAIVNDEYTSIPLFGSLRKALTNRHPYNQTIFSVIKDDEQLEYVISDIENLVKDDKDNGIGLLFTVPVGQVHSLGNKES